MPGEKHPIIAHGELYVEPIVKKSRPIDKSIPHEYEDSKQRILSDISNITEKIEIQEEFFLDEKILCVRMEPKFEAKSYVPVSITQVSDSISLRQPQRAQRHLRLKEGHEWPAASYCP